MAFKMHVKMSGCKLPLESSINNLKHFLLMLLFVCHTKQLMRAKKRIRCTVPDLKISMTKWKSTPELEGKKVTEGL